MIILSLGKALMHKESSPYLVRLCPPISSTSVVGIRKLVVQIHRMGVILMGYWVVGQVRTMMISVLNKSKLNMGKSLGVFS